MTSTNLKREQAEQLRRDVGRPLRYLGKPRRRMEVLGFPPSDPLYRATCDAFNSMHAMHIAAHYASCSSGVGTCR